MTWDPVTKAKTSKTFCITPWIHQYVGTHGDVKPCCIYKHELELGSLKANSLEEIWNSTETKKLRKDMLEGVTPAGCKICTDAEKYTDQSHRLKFNEKFLDELNCNDTLINTLEDGHVPLHKLYYMDVRFNNLCNFKCMTCTPVYSSSLSEDYKKVHPLSAMNSGFSFPGKTETDLFDQILPHLKDVKEVYFAGGEPMMQKEHYMVLEKLIELNCNPIIRYNTNFSRLNLGKHNVLDLWKKFDTVLVHASLDGCHEQAEYWRKETDWQTIVNNRKILLHEMPHVKFVIACTVSWPNALNVLRLHKEWYELGYIGINDFSINPVFGPDYFSLTVLPTWKIEKIEQAYLEHIGWLSSLNENSEWIINKFKDIILHMKSKYVDNNFPAKDFCNAVNGFDNIRKNNNSFFQIFPEHDDMKIWLNNQGYNFCND